MQRKREYECSAMHLVHHALHVLRTCMRDKARIGYGDHMTAHTQHTGQFCLTC